MGDYITGIDQGHLQGPDVDVLRVARFPIDRIANLLIPRYTAPKAM